MAYTITRNKTVFGNLRVVGLDVTADAATQTIETGLKNVIFATGACPISMNTLVGYKIALNSNASGVQSFGVLGVSGITSGDHFSLVVFGT
jgi:hypothetical protein